MPRSRLGVVLLLPAPASTEVDVLRRAVGAGDVDRLAPHLTLVPPINVRHDDLDSALDLLRDAAGRTSPFRLVLGPPRTFLPINPVLYLEVGGDVRAVDSLRDKIFRPPLERNLTWPFQPHVTVLDGGDEARIRAAADALADFRVEFVVERVHLLEEHHREEDGQRAWRPFAEATFGGPAIVGRGGLELELEVGERLLADAAAFSERAWEQHAGPWPKVPLAVTARRQGRVVGVAAGHTRPDGEAYLGDLIVAADARREGIGAHLVAAFSSAAAGRGCTFVTVRTEAAGFYERLGFRAVHDLPTWRGGRDLVRMRRDL